MLSRLPTRPDPVAVHAPPPPGELIVLVHGIWMHGAVMKIMAQHLSRRGFRTLSLSYDFLGRSPADNADALAERLRTLDVQRLHIVAHSLGGIVTLHLLDRHPGLPVDKVVLLGSPVRGSGVARQVYANVWLRPLLGRSVEAGLLGGAPAFPRGRPLGVINGSGRVGITGLLYPPGERSDGVVAAAETLEDEATDRVTVPRSHSTMLFSRTCADLVASFVRNGRFERRA